MIEYLEAFVLIFGVAAATVFVLGKARISPVIGFLVAGVLIGPHGFDLIRDAHEVELLAEIGVVLLMFTIGLEFSLKNLLRLRVLVLGGGSLQVLLTVAAVTLLSYRFLGQSLNNAVFDGFLVSLSSTAIVFKLLLDRAEMNAPHGKASVGILIFQDLCVVPFMLFIPALAGSGGDAYEIVLTLVKAAFVVAAVLLAAKWLVPRILHQVVSTRSRELFVISIIVLCLGTALLTSMLGLSLALGAFLAGVVISESEYAAQAVSDVLPFKESFTGLFFISVGMLLNLRMFLDAFLQINALVLSIVVIKLVCVLIAAYAAGQSLRSSLQAALYLPQIGEFSFVLAQAGKAHGLIGENLYQQFISASVMTMIATPFLIKAAGAVSSWLVSVPLMRALERKRMGGQRERYPGGISEHVIIVGFGVNGSNLARVLRMAGIPYLVVELNSDAVRRAKRKGEPIYYGDATSVEILRKLSLETARVMVIAISDAAATRRVLQLAKRENPRAEVIARTRYVAEVEDLMKLGADDVIPEEFETSIEIFSRVLHRYRVPVNVIREHIETVRRDSYRPMREVELPHRSLATEYERLKDLDLETYEIRRNSGASDRTLKELDLRAKTGVTVLGVERGDDLHQMPPPSFLLKARDVLLFIGTREAVGRAVHYLGSLDDGSSAAQ